jgi:flagellar hook assembly protein FlgD
VALNNKPGTHFVEWNGKNNTNQKLSSGMYIVKLSTKEKTWTKKILMSK